MDYDLWQLVKLRLEVAKWPGRVVGQNGNRDMFIRVKVETSWVDPKHFLSEPFKILLMDLMGNLLNVVSHENSMTKICIKKFSF